MCDLESPRGVPQLSRTEVRRVARFLINPLHWEIESSHEFLHTNTDVTFHDDGRKTYAKDTWWTDMPSCFFFDIFLKLFFFFTFFFFDIFLTFFFFFFLTFFLTFFFFFLFFLTFFYFF